MGLGRGRGLGPGPPCCCPLQAMGRLWKEGRFWDMRPPTLAGGTGNFQKTHPHTPLLADLSPRQPSLSVQRPRRASKTSRDLLRPPCAHAQSFSLSDPLQPHGLYVAHRAHLSMGFPRQEYWSGLLRPPPGHLPDPGIEPESPAAPVSAGGFSTTEPPGKPLRNSQIPTKIQTSQRPQRYLERFRGLPQRQKQRCRGLSGVTQPWGHPLVVPRFGHTHPTPSDLPVTTLR